MSDDGGWRFSQSPNNPHKTLHFMNSLWFWLLLKKSLLSLVLLLGHAPTFSNQKDVAIFFFLKIITCFEHFNCREVRIPLSLS